MSNQSGVGRGLITREQVDSVNIELVRQLGHEHIHTFYHSYATPDDPYATDRKPSPELLLNAAREHDSIWRTPFSSATGSPTSSAASPPAAGPCLLAHAKSSRRDEVSEDDSCAHEAKRLQPFRRAAIFPRPPRGSSKERPG